MAYKDLREWITQVEEMGELLRLDHVDWNLEMGAITEIFRQESRLRPAILFNHIQSYPPGYGVIVSTLNTVRRLALTTNMPLVQEKPAFIQAWRDRIKTLQLLPPREVSTGPVMENVHDGSYINLHEFPAPFWHELDGGRYLGTACSVITRDPDGGPVNLGTYRVMVHGEDTLGLYMTPGRHGHINRQKYWERGKPFPVAISFGHDPLIFFVSAIELPISQSEYDYAGGIKGEPIEVIRGEYTGLPIPATSEIAIEGECLPEERKEEGPFGEWTGYYASGSRPEPVIRVKRVMHRNDPIICGAPPSKPPTDSTFFSAMLRSALTWNEMEAAGIPDIRGIWGYEEGGGKMFVVVSIKQRYPGHARQAGMVAALCHATSYMGRFVVVVDEDIDPFNLKDVIWAMSSRADPATSIEIIRRCWSGPLDPLIPPEIKEESKTFNSRAIIDACKPYEWMKDFPPTATTSPELRQKVLEKWGETLRSLDRIP
ncbi:MAG: UbiD family decarboxylase [Chloroflexi bacterium]|nr:UbiD family decarboxylase [Chloroflexota bacterium]